MLAILIPSRSRTEELKNLLADLSECTDRKNYEVIIVSDSCKETAEAAALFRFSGFGRYEIIESEKRLYSIKAFNVALDNVRKSDLICWLADDVSLINIFWAREYIFEFEKNFPDGVGVMSLRKNSGAGIGISSHDFIEYSESRLYYPGYTLHYADSELTHKAIFMGRFKWPKANRIGLLNCVPDSVDPAEKFSIVEKDKALYAERSANSFYIPSNKIRFPNHDITKWEECNVR